ncbi:MAG: glycoside hydrolase family 57 protein [Spirochaetia bacterium]|nr:glycoside hydrolase family 57 protein [Spirochaetia bacterium]
MTSICFYFQVHQPYRLRPYHFFDIGENVPYEDDEKNIQIIKKVSEKCYIPATNILLELIEKYNGKFKIAFSLSGVFIEQAKQHYPLVIDNFKKLAKTGCVEFLAETYYHSLSSLVSEEEFKAQVKLHTKLIEKEFNYTPAIFRNTELIFSNHIAWLAGEMGFKGMLLEGADKILDWRNPNFVYKAKYAPNLKLLLKNYKLSDDIAFRFSEKSWKEYPLSSEKYAGWIHSVAGSGDVVNLFMDFETFGEHQWEDSGIFNFLRALPENVFKHPDFEFLKVSEAIEKYPVVGDIDTHDPVSWADIERDLSAWLGNNIQNEAFRGIYDLQQKVYDSDNKKLLEVFRRLQTSDHFYYMCTKYFNDGDVHKYFNPFESPYDAYIYYMNVLQDFRQKLDAKTKQINKSAKVSKTTKKSTLKKTKSVKPKTSTGYKKSQFTTEIMVENNIKSKGQASNILNNKVEKVKKV